MSYTIKTAEAFKLPIASQTRAWDLGAENVIARMAFTTSLEMTEPIHIDSLLDAKGKEYNAKVLFGSFRATYEAMLCLREGITASHPDFKKYVKAHVDRGLGVLIDFGNLDLAQLFDVLVDVKD